MYLGIKHYINGLNGNEIKTLIGTHDLSESDSGWSISMQLCIRQEFLNRVSHVGPAAKAAPRCFSAKRGPDEPFDRYQRAWHHLLPRG